MKSCELCKLAATTSCESDQASLCWDCDAVVHGANFLVARHVRCLLCHACQSLTPWRATGSKLGRTVSVCERCIDGGDREESEAENDDDGDGEDDEGDDSDDDVSVGDDVEDGDNQVVPWSTVANTPPPAPSSSSSDNYSGGEREDDPDRLSSKRRYGYHTVVATRCRAEGGGVSVDSRTMRLSKDQQIKPEGTVQLQSDSRGATSTESLGKN
ncbi:zinc finger protein CONSTANS-LIKE 3-like isoform X2 [Gossypium arboreum]|uniref:zinc finger protein CONSTANS-LIKE 3-like isoform X2 n=1 Tax=Gossypium arboreum TaxID=29729 RepID=UPI0022F193DF|nr:zinc finger protein CONSTANS-LIKE 3-like isoform X2 [Gossypium arboreum]